MVLSNTPGNDFLIRIFNMLQKIKKEKNKRKKQQYCINLKKLLYSLFPSALSLKFIIRVIKIDFINLIFY